MRRVDTGPRPVLDVAGLVRARPNREAYWRPRRGRAGVALLVGAFVVLAVLAAAAVALRGAWHESAWRQEVRVDERTVRVPVALAIRLATTRAGAAWLDGRTVETAAGALTFGREPGTGRLTATCAPCRVAVPALGPEPVVLANATVTVARAGRRLAGTLSSGGAALAFEGELARDGLDVRFVLPETPVADALAPFAAEVPELDYARLDGTLRAEGSLAWPAGTLELHTHFAGLRVEGLGTERLARLVPRPPCGATARVGRGLAWQRLAAAVAAGEPTPPAGAGPDPIALRLARLVYADGATDAAAAIRAHLYAVELQRTVGRGRVLDLWLATAPWGSGGCGAQAAARALYGRGLDGLSVAETARLAAALRDDVAWRDVDAAVRIARSMAGITRTERAAALAELCAGAVTHECVERRLNAAL
jgi:hypothetical protein